MKRDAGVEAARPRPPGATAAAPGRVSEPGPAVPGDSSEGWLGAILLPLLGLLMAPLIVTGYVGLAVLALPVLGFRSLLRKWLE